MAAVIPSRLCVLAVLYLTINYVLAVNLDIFEKETGPKYRQLPKKDHNAVFMRNIQLLRRRLYYKTLENSDGAAYFDADGCAKLFDTETHRCFAGSSTRFQCVPESTICDGYYQCDDKSDEIGCPAIDATGVTTPYLDGSGCAKWYPDRFPYRCGDGSYCIGAHALCNGKITCPDKSDEIPSACELKPTEEPDTLHTVKPAPTEAPVEKTDAPVVKTEAPVVKTEAPVVKTEAPVVKTEAPVVKTEVPVVKTEAPVLNTDAPVPDVQTQSPAPQAYYDTDGCASWFPTYPYRCVDGSMCLTESFLCDGLSYCEDFSDENGCTDFGKTDEHGCTIPNQVGNTGEDDYNRQVLEAHNYFRCLHGLSFYTWNEDLAVVATEVAEQNARDGNIEHSNRGYGENLGYAGVPSFNHISGYALVKLWYEEIDLYDYSNPGFQSGTGHFTQMIWAGNTDVGCGTATDGNRVYLACEYTPGGNIATAEYFQNNVLPPL